MPNFAHAEISSTSEDLTEYTGFLRKLAIGQVVSLPLEEGESSRKVMRALNSAAKDCSLRLARLASDGHSVKFKVVPLEKRPVNISPEARRRRIEKARATRLARKQLASR